MARSLLSTRGNRLHSLTIVKFVFVLTDGMSTNMTTTKEAAFRLQGDATVVAIGVGRDVSHAELKSIASPPDPDANSLSYVYSVANFDAINGLIDRLIDATCEKCRVSHMTDIFVVIDDLSESAMNQQEFGRALNGLTYIAQYLPAYRQVNGQKVNITTIGDLGYRHTSIPNATDLDSLLMSIQSIRQQQSFCYINECEKALALNISSGMIQIINITGRNNDQRNNSRKIIVVFSSGRFTDKSLVRLELQDALNESNIDIFAIGPGYDTDMEGLHALVKEPFNVFSLIDYNLETLDVLKSKLSYIVCS
ncbi:uncharacterized protein LOC127858225 [Dreissena polymorpha]|uniref:VWFA domain-containing protein n=1 Tax=Dreissena polymorpha TaxID=45954 RepID=A0A9D4BUE9_DREPO|nr:uncharacterized protein LOC127858225 [Dreissena polymorpha]KAH3709264.1 hypothetical protein DPMN_068726 [Dreissena polymorpha]